LGIPAPKDVRARAETFKDVQTEADLVAEPAEETESARLVEFDGYRDPRFVPKVMLRCALSFRVFRGGCWKNGAEDCRAADRSGFGPSSRSRNLGFRLAKPVSFPDNFSAAAVR
jgi:formylglycine-generating enzyme required for sulfatase activity